MGEVRKIGFCITGEFVTQTARQWFWDEHRPWEKVEGLLLSCMAGTMQSEQKLKSHARDVVFGLAKFIGNTADGSYALVEDHEDLVVQNVERMDCNAKKTEKDLKELTRKHLDLVERLEDEGYSWLIKPHQKVGKNFSPLLQSFFEAEKHDDNYGWLAPDGTFHAVEWGEHQSWAYNKLVELEAIDDSTLYNAREGDALVERGWALLHNSGLGIAEVTKSQTKTLTKAQREFLFGYYTDRGKDDIARKYIEEG